MPPSLHAEHRRDRVGTVPRPKSTLLQDGASVMPAASSAWKEVGIWQRDSGTWEKGTTDFCTPVFPVTKQMGV